MQYDVYTQTEVSNGKPSRRSGNFAEDRERASEAGKKGGQHSGGNFKNDPQRASEAGKKGGKSSHGKSDN
ncbi:TPA: general stress protein [Escherichia coli]|nr:general stress protein [Escherichia coli]